MKQDIFVSHPKSGMLYPKTVEVVDGYIQIVKVYRTNQPANIEGGKDDTHRPD